MRPTPMQIVLVVVTPVCSETGTAKMESKVASTKRGGRDALRASNGLQARQAVLKHGFGR